MAMFYVRWSIDVDAESFEEAAQTAYEMQRREGSTATVYEVWKGDEQPDIDAPETVDLLEVWAAARGEH